MFIAELPFLLFLLVVVEPHKKWFGLKVLLQTHGAICFCEWNWPPAEAGLYCCTALLPVLRQRAHPPWCLPPSCYSPGLLETPASLPWGGQGGVGWGGVEGQETASRAWLACTHAPPCHAAKANFMQPVASVSCSPSSLCPSGIQFQKPFPHSHSEFTILSSEHGLSLIQN